MIKMAKKRNSKKLKEIWEIIIIEIVVLICLIFMTIFSMKFIFLPKSLFAYILISFLLFLDGIVIYGIGYIIWSQLLKKGKK